MEKLKEYLKENLTTDNLKEMARSVNSYNGGLDYLDYYENGEDFFQMFFEGRIDECVRAICYGDYNYMDDYVKFNAYGNLTSANEWEYEQEIEDYKNEIIDNYLDIYESDKDYFKWDECFKLIEQYEEEQEARNNYTCTCGNTADDLGFYPCDENGEEIEPDEDSDWANLYVCGKCKNVINFDEI